MADEAIQAIGGRRGGAGTPTGERVVVRLRLEGEQRAPLERILAAVRAP
jgi:hypothetical protein